MKGRERKRGFNGDSKRMSPIIAATAVVATVTATGS